MSPCIPTTSDTREESFVNRRPAVRAMLWASFLAVLLVCSTIGTASADYVAGLWSTNAVAFLDAGFVQYGGFSLDPATSPPNGIATDGTTIWVGTFSQQRITRYDFAGNVLGFFTDPGFEFLQGMELVGGELAVASASGPGTISFYDPITGAFIRQIGDPGVGNIEALAFDGTSLFARGTPIAAVDPVSGATNYTIPNPGTGFPYEGTGLTSIGGNRLALAGAGGDWIVLSSLDGSVIATGNNGLDMYALKSFDATPVPEPASLTLLGVGAAGLLVLRRRRRR